MSNVYLGKSVPPSRFIGRKDEMAEIRDAIYGCGSAELVGPHRTGKSALCRRLCEELENDDELVSHVVDLQHLTTPRFRNAIVAITGVPLECETSLPNEHAGSDIEAIDALINYVKHMDKMLVIFFDEMDAGAVHKGCFNEWNSSLRTLRYRASVEECDEIAIVRVFSSSPDRYGSMHKLEDISQSIGRDPFVRMKPISEEQAKRLYDETNRNEKVDSEFAIKYTGKFPLLIEILSFHSSKINSDQVNYVELLQKAYEQSESFYLDLYRHIESIDNPSETLISAIFSLAFEATISTNNQLSPKETLKFDLDDYELRQLISLGVVDEKENIKILFSPLFSWWLSRRALYEMPDQINQFKRAADLLGVKNVKDLLGLVKTSMSTGSSFAALL